MIEGIFLNDGVLGSLGTVATLYPRGKEYTLNGTRIRYMIEGIFFNDGVFGSLGTVAT